MKEQTVFEMRYPSKGDYPTEVGSYFVLIIRGESYERTEIFWEDEEDNYKFACAEYWLNPIPLSYEWLKSKLSSLTPTGVNGGEGWDAIYEKYKGKSELRATERPAFEWLYDNYNPPTRK